MFTLFGLSNIYNFAFRCSGFHRWTIHSRCCHRCRCVLAFLHYFFFFFYSHWIRTPQPIFLVYGGFSQSNDMYLRLLNGFVCTLYCILVYIIHVANTKHKKIEEPYTPNANRRHTNSNLEMVTHRTINISYRKLQTSIP